jgi:predicted  nucleic acid-binding Zn-ribbon protein
VLCSFANVAESNVWTDLPQSRVGTVASVCIAGMHRSGTSMVARILNLCGLDLGPEHSIVAPAADNPDGFWEHRKLQEINEAILEELGGAWDRPPNSGVPDRTTEVSSLVSRVHTVSREMTPPWGWKDPRNSLLLPFWKSLYPGVKVVVCVRGPLDVVVSLRRRNGFSYESGLALWYEYNRSIIEATEPDERLIVHFDAFFTEPRNVVEKLVAFSGLVASEDKIAAAVGSIQPERRHSDLSSLTLLEAEVHPAIRSLYKTLCVEGGLVPEDGEEFSSEAWPGRLEGRLLNRVVVEARVFERELLRVRDALDQYRDALTARDSQLDDLRRSLSDQERQLHATRSRAAQTEQELEAIRTVKQAAEQQLIAARNELTDLRRECDRLSISSGNYQSELDTVRAHSADMEGHLGEARQTVAEQAAELARLSAEAESIRLALQSEQSAGESERTALRAERDDLRRTAAELERDLNGVREQLRSLRETMDSIASSRTWRVATTWWRIAGSLKGK